MDQEQIVSELMERIQQDLRFFKQDMPERNAIAWRGYLAGLLEWGPLTPAHHDQLIKLIPDIQDDPVVAILLGREDEPNT